MCLCSRAPTSRSSARTSTSRGLCSGVSLALWLDAESAANTIPGAQQMADKITVTHFMIGSPFPVLAGSLYHRTVGRPEFIRVLIIDGVLGGQRLIDPNAPARLLIDPGIAILDLHPTLEDVLHDGRVIKMFV